MPINQVKLLTYRCLALNQQALHKSLIASSSESGMFIDVSSPARCNLASMITSLRSVLTLSPDFLGIFEGATIQQSTLSCCSLR